MQDNEEDCIRSAQAYRLQDLRLRRLSVSDTILFIVLHSKPALTA